MKVITYELVVQLKSDCICNMDYDMESHLAGKAETWQEVTQVSTPAHGQRPCWEWMQGRVTPSRHGSSGYDPRKICDILHAKSCILVHYLWVTTISTLDDFSYNQEINGILMDRAGTFFHYFLIILTSSCFLSLRSFKSQYRLNVLIKHVHEQGIVQGIFGLHNALPFPSLSARGTGYHPGKFLKFQDASG
jgi:hypothetical protein